MEDPAGMQTVAKARLYSWFYHELELTTYNMYLLWCGNRNI